MAILRTKTLLGAEPSRVEGLGDQGVVVTGVMDTV